jgi:hypothetical protein
MALTVLSTHRRLCSECLHGYLGNQGVFCVEYREVVGDEQGAAADCPSFEGNGTPPPLRPAVVHQVEVVAKTASANGGKGVEVATTYEDLVGMCDRYLAKRRCVLWGEPFEIVTPKGRQEAAEWLATQISGLGMLADTTEPATDPTPKGDGS